MAIQTNPSTSAYTGHPESHGSPLASTGIASQPYGGAGLMQTQTSLSRKSNRTPKWWKIRLFRGMINDVRRRAPFYVSDWTDAWDYRVIPATVYMYFAK
jgi:hypothetical protein